MAKYEVKTAFSVKNNEIVHKSGKAISIEDACHILNYVVYHAEAQTRYFVDVYVDEI